MLLVEINLSGSVVRDQRKVVWIRGEVVFGCGVPWDGDWSVGKMNKM